MSKAAWRKCFEKLGVPLSDPELKVLVKLARKIEEEGSAEVVDGHEFDAVLEPDLDGMDATEEADLDLDSTIGAAIRTFRQLGEGASLVPSSYVPIAMGNSEMALLVGVDGPRRGKLFEIALEGQDQTIGEHGDVTEIGVLADVVF
jgi:hypothetical protein